MQIQRAAAVPLITHDPYFSVWSVSDRLNDADVAHWSGLRQQICGYVRVDGHSYRFMGAGSDWEEVLPQTGLDVTATGTTYTFENDMLTLTVRFVSPLLFEDLYILSRPCTYIDFFVERHGASEVEVFFTAGEELIRNMADEKTAGQELQWASGDYPISGSDKTFSFASFGQAVQRPLGGSGDNVTIDWGFLYLASADAGAKVYYDQEKRCLTTVVDLGGDSKEASLVIAYDDLVSINYFGSFVRGYWTQRWPTILEAISATIADKEETLKCADAFDRKLEKAAKDCGGEDYAFLCTMSYRHTIAAHKLIADENGKLIFLSKENDSNGCIGTVDLSYPSAPLFLMECPELVKGMLRPIFRFASGPGWPFDYSPHDVGRYPYAWGQVYGATHARDGSGPIGYTEAQNTVNPAFYLYANGEKHYHHCYQMPVEECGNMLILTAALCVLEHSADFAAPYMEILENWCNYLIENGEDPGEQLCTDDFAGHLAHNVNLSIKAILGIEGFSKILALMGEKEQEEAAKLHEKAKTMAESVEMRSFTGNNYALAFGDTDTFSLKYNAVWDLFFESRLFSDDFYEREQNCYLARQNDYGTPLDTRASYTKSDWLLWCAAMAKDREKRILLTAPVARYLRETTSRYPFSDWYDTQTGEYCHFKGRSVQGGIYMPLLIERSNGGKQ